MTKIDLFRGQYNWLSNFYKCDIYYNGLHYNSVEAAFQAQKDPSKANEFCNITNPVMAKHKGKNVSLRSDWDKVKVDIMQQLILIKFNSNEELKQKLLETDNIYLEEGNKFHDHFWGVSDGYGQNILGKILMNVRKQLRDSNTKVVC